MLNIPGSNFYFKPNENDTRPTVLKQRDVLLASRQTDLKTGEVTVIFSRTTPEKLAQFKSLKPLMLAAREEVDNLLKQSYFNKRGENIPKETLKDLREKMSMGDEKKYTHSSEKIASSAKQAQNKTQSHDTKKSDVLPANKTKLPKIISPPKNAYSAEFFENILTKIK